VELGPLGEDLGAGPARRPAADRARRRLALFAIGLLGLALLAGVVAKAVTARHGSSAVADQPRFQGSDVRAPEGVRVRVEVFNAAQVRGLGRRAMLYLRDQGFDVVTLATMPATRDTTLVVARGTHESWARLVARALGESRVESRADSSRDVDVSVYLGSTWRPPAQPFYP